MAEAAEITVSCLPVEIRQKILLELDTESLVNASHSSTLFRDVLLGTPGLCRKMTVHKEVGFRHMPLAIARFQAAKLFNESVKLIRSHRIVFVPDGRLLRIISQTLSSETVY